MKRWWLGLVLAGAMTVGGVSPAYADHGSYRDGCGENGGGCNNEREEDYGDGSCKYFCPAFDRSPVEDSFNPVVCLPGATCNVDRDPKEKPNP